ncbi:MAG: aerobic carbon-monoxide dehydrogenase small subunit [Gammaproteobacteria bacterium]|jgi:carbon-monoxide dehydrogenase small subunit|nr:aerobic carbon-monoxide dehydrogenase small subunit [Gammaproteobacteria bacterium]
MAAEIPLVEVDIRVNGRLVRARTEPRQLLVEFVRLEAGLTGTHVGCDTSYCGACTVLLDGRSVKSCTLLTVQADGCSVRTVEGLARDEALHPLQQAFAEHHALQCGYCTPGFLMSAVQLLDQNPDPDEAAIRKALAGNVCRCTGYINIIAAVRAAAERMRCERGSDEH